MKILKAIVATTLLISDTCNAGAYGDELTKCAVERTDEAGKTALMRWLFIASAKHPENKEMYMKNDMVESLAELAAANTFADTFGRACKIEADRAVKIEGKDAMLGAVAGLFFSAMTHAFSNANVGMYMNETDKLFTDQLEKKRKYSESFKH